MVFFLLSPGVKILYLKKIFYQKDAFRIRLSSSNLIRKGLARVHLFVLSLRYRSALCSDGVSSFKFRIPQLNKPALLRMTPSPLFATHSKQKPGLQSIR